MTDIALHSRSYGEQGPCVIILHGLFGSARNWHSQAQLLAANYRVYTLDLRNHGESPHAERMDYPAMAADVVAFMRARGLDEVSLIGHSMGGKVAMQIALNSDVAVRALVVVDIAPRRYPPHHDDVLDAMQSIDLGAAQSRNDIDAGLEARIPDNGLRQFILTNVVRTADGFGWRVNLPAIVSDYDALAAAPEDARAYSGPTLFIVGGQSDYVGTADRARIESLFPAATVATIADSGHWPHAEHPGEFAQLVADFLQARAA